MDNQRFYARSASDKTDDWPYWFVADGDRAGLNVTLEVGQGLRSDWTWMFTQRDTAINLAKSANERTPRARVTSAITQAPTVPHAVKRSSL